MQELTRPVAVEHDGVPATVGVAAAASALVVLATGTGTALSGSAAGAYRERGLTVAELIVLLSAAALVPVAVAAMRTRNEALGLALAGVCTCVPLWAGWNPLPAELRALVLAVGPLAVGGLAWMVRSPPGLLLASTAAVLHALAYDPFGDIGCARVCLEVSPRLEISTAALTGSVAGLLAAAATFVVMAAIRTPRDRATSTALGAVILAVLSGMRWRWVDDPAVFDLVLLAAPVVPGLVAAPVLLAGARRWRERRAVRRLVAALGKDPDRKPTEGGHLDPTALSAAALTPGDLLAWRNAELIALAQLQVDEVRASQRRVVAAADAERHRIERDLHDGAQQRLVGVLMQLSGLGLENVEAEVRRVLGDLRTFGERGFPRVLDEEGLGPALEELAASSDAQVSLVLPAVLDVPAQQARAVYALVAATATRGQIVVTVTREEDTLQVLVHGAPCDPPELVRDRFGALAGRLDVLERRPPRCCF